MGEANLVDFLDQMTQLPGTEALEQLSDGAGSTRVFRYKGSCVSIGEHYHELWDSSRDYRSLVQSYAGIFERRGLDEKSLRDCLVESRIVLSRLEQSILSVEYIVSAINDLKRIGKEGGLRDRLGKKEDASARSDFFYIATAVHAIIDSPEARAEFGYMAFEDWHFKHCSTRKSPYDRQIISMISADDPDQVVEYVHYPHASFQMTGEFDSRNAGADVEEFQKQLEEEGKRLLDELRYMRELCKKPALRQEKSVTSNLKNLYRLGV